jgi:hypothetical protein
MTRAGLIVLAVNFCVSARSFGAADVDPVWLERARTGVGTVFEQYVARPPSFEEVAEMRYENWPPRGGPFRNRTIRMVTSRLGENSISETTTVYDDQKDKPKTTVVCSNGDYRFVVTREGVDSPHQLVKYEPGNPRANAPSGGLGMYAYDVLSSVRDAVAGREGTVLKALRWDDQRRLLNARLAVTAVRDGKPNTQDHDIWLDPDHQWRVVERTLTVPVSVTRIAVAYGEPVDGMPYPSQITESVSPQGADAGPAYQIRTELKRGKTTKVPGDFRLAAFGLPEPVEFQQNGPERRVRNYVWLGIGAAVCVALALGFRRLARRGRPAPAG